MTASPVRQDTFGIVPMASAKMGQPGKCYTSRSKIRVYSMPMMDGGGHDFVNKAITVNLWGMDASLKPFTSAARTRQIADGAVEVVFNRQLALGEIVGLGYRGMKSRFRVVQSFLAAADTYRITLVDLGGACMWKEEMASPDVIVPRGERRSEPRLPVVGNAKLINAEGTSSTAKLTDVSHHGCYIETFAPSPVNAEMRLIVSLEGAQPVDLKARVRTSHPSIGMGMQVVGFGSPEDEDRFHTVVGALMSQQGVM